jgi:hypothetical protein
MMTGHKQYSGYWYFLALIMIKKETVGKSRKEWETVGKTEKGSDTLFVTLKQASKDTGLPYKRLYNDVRAGILPAVKKGNSYYIYTADMGEYCYRLACEARKQDPDRYRCLWDPGSVMTSILDDKEVKKDDKPKNEG